MIIRSKRSDNFTVVNNAVINDARLDWKELGLLVYLLSKPDNWQVCPAHLMAQRKTGKDGIYRMLKNLRDAGFIEMQKQADGKTNWLVFDAAMAPVRPYPEKPDVAIKPPYPEKPDKPANSPYPEKPDPENPPLIKTELITKTEYPPLAGEMKSCFDWATGHPFWSGSVTSIGKFLELYGRASPNGLKAQYQNDLARQSPSSEASHATHQHVNQNNSRKLTPAERVAIACGYDPGNG